MIFSESAIYEYFDVYVVLIKKSLYGMKSASAACKTVNVPRTGSPLVSVVPPPHAQQSVFASKLPTSKLPH